MLRPSTSKDINVLEYFECQDIDNILIQINKIYLVKWEFVENTINFWAEVQNYKDAGNNKPFSGLAEFAIKIFSLHGPTQKFNVYSHK